MKIAHIAPPWIAIPPENYGGTEIVIYNLVEEQVALGHDVTLFAPGDARTSAKQVSFFQQSLVSAGVPWSAHLKAYYHLYKSLAHAHEFDIVHTHLSSGADLYIFPLTAPLTTPHITTLHSRFPFDRLPEGWMGDADSFFMEWAAQVPVIAISESARAEVPHPLNFVGVVHHGLPMERFQPIASKRGEHFVWLGRMVEDKGVHLAIEAAKRAGVPLVLAGTVDRHAKDSVEYFHEVIEPQIDGEQITYIGPVDMQQKIELLSGARGFLNPIVWEEPFGMVMIEAMALGCPVISFARGAAPEIVVHRKTGFLVHDVDEMVEFIPLIDQIDRDVTRTHVERHFSARVMAEKNLQLYKKVIRMSKEAAKQPLPTISLREPLVQGSAGIANVAALKTVEPAQVRY